MHLTLKCIVIMYSVHNFSFSIVEQYHLYNKVEWLQSWQQYQTKLFAIQVKGQPLRIRNISSAKYNAQSLNPMMVAHNLTKAVDKRLHYVQNYCVVSLSIYGVILHWLRYVWGSSVSVVQSWKVSASRRLECISSMVKLMKGMWSVPCAEVVRFSEGLLLLEVLL